LDFHYEIAVRRTDATAEPGTLLLTILYNRAPPKAFFTRSEVYLALASSFTVGVPCQTFGGSIWNKF
jgi:hypothetical protein